ncbi:SRPBCC domain-containing protein [Micromonospora sp. WMMD1102]|uniref:SRPBCC domain-containing protein n=1 Tax=Micromonospora sp. WMMD1102 TaxID=3016105 RepID=UPI0024152141|nr:SRPBCC domain-containing protein [Micromonospora sp. WMMD1102]MDG4790570.1 SRPBCC domain-containing protein [Micromonospora sp. WMMD1102]
MTTADRHRIPIVRAFDAPRELVFRTWTRAEEVGTWFAPPGFEVTRCEVDARPGGRWQVEYRSARGGTYREYGEFREVVPPGRLVLTLAQVDADGNTTLETLVTVLLADRDGKTEMTFEQTGFESVAVRDAVADGWRGCFDKLDTHLAEVPTGKESR